MRSGSVGYPFTASGVVGPNPGTDGFTYVVGISLRETAGTSPVSATLRNDGSPSGAIRGEYTAPAGGSLPPGHLPDIRVEGQLYVTVSGAGTASGVLYIR